METYRNQEAVAHIYEEHIKEKFGFAVSEDQLKIVTACINKENVFAVLPTGAGKSMCYILPPLILDWFDPDIHHISLVVSPLKSLMLDQVSSLTEKGIHSRAVTSHNLSDDIMTELLHDKPSVLFVSPEAITDKAGTKLLSTDIYQTSLCVIAIDEAHCISQWGNEFRESYKDLGILRSYVSQDIAPVLTLTATATEEIQKDICKELILDQESTVTVARLPDRPNIFLHMEKCTEVFEEELKWIPEMLVNKGVTCPKMIIYCRSLNACGRIYNWLLSELGEAAYVDNESGEGDDSEDCIIDMYHASSTNDTHTWILNEFPKVNSMIRCIIATIAFGMGVQIPDIRIVVHWGAPANMLSYWQEAGRCSRDGKLGVALLKAYPRSLSKQLTSEGLKKTVTEATTECIRTSVLLQLACKGLDVSVVEEMKKKVSCPGSCTGNTCCCANCRCCSQCQASCTCEQNVKDTIKKIETLS